MLGTRPGRSVLAKKEMPCPHGAAILIGIVVTMVKGENKVSSSPRGWLISCVHCVGPRQPQTLFQMWPGRYFSEEMNTEIGPLCIKEIVNAAAWVGLVHQLKDWREK